MGPDGNDENNIARKKNSLKNSFTGPVTDTRLGFNAISATLALGKDGGEAFNRKLNHNNLAICPAEEI